MSTTFIARVNDIKKVSYDKAILRLLIDSEFFYQAGQYIEINIPGYEPRFYSIANSPVGSKELEIHIKDNGKGGVGTYALNKMKSGEEINIKGPFGKCVWRNTDKNILLLLAGGMGIAPIKAIMEAAIAHAYKGKIILHWGINDIEDLYMKEKIEEIGKKHPEFLFEVVVAYPVGEVVVSQYPDLSETEIYISGPFAMINSVLPLLLENGAEQTAINTDRTELLHKVYRSDKNI